MSLHCDVSRAARERVDLIRDELGVGVGRAADLAIRAADESVLLAVARDLVEQDERLENSFKGRTR